MNRTATVNPPAPVTAPPLFSAAEASKWLGIPERTLLRFVDSGRLEAIDMSPTGKYRKLKFRASALEHFLDSQILRPAGTM